MVVEGHFGRALSMRVLCSLLQGVAKCSEKLGVAKLSHKGCDVNIYRTGRIDVHGVASEEEAIELIDGIRVIVEGAFAANVDESKAALNDENPHVR